jgi:hypothetical protein
MSTYAQLGYSTLVDVVNEYATGSAKEQALIAARILDRKCPLVRILPMIKANEIMSNIGSRDSLIGNPGTRRFNEPILPTLTRSTQISEPIALFEDYGEVDRDLCYIQNEPAVWRMNQDRRKIEGMTQKLEATLFYGSMANDPGVINGLATRFGVSTYLPNGDASWPYNVILGGGSGSTCSSIWIIEFGPHKVFGIYPPNLPGGLQIRDLGEQTKEINSSGNLNAMYQVLRTHYQWFIGIEIDDERCVQRYANINAAVAAEQNIFDEEILITLKNQLPGMGEAPGTAIFMDRSLKTQVDIRAVTQKMNTYFTQDQATGDVWGRAVTRFQGIPIFVAEKLLDTETAIS